MVSLQPGDERDHLPRGDQGGHRRRDAGGRARLRARRGHRPLRRRRSASRRGWWRSSARSALIDTPISEEAFVGAALGAAWMGERPIAELQFADFITCPFDVIMTVGAKTHWRSGIRLPIVVRAAVRRRRARRPVPRLVAGGVVRRHGRAEGRLPGIGRGRLRAPSRSAIDDDDPVLYFEHKAPLPPACAARSPSRPTGRRSAAPGSSAPARPPRS